MRAGWGGFRFWFCGFLVGTGSFGGLGSFVFGGCGAGVFGCWCCTLSTWSGFYPFSFWWGSFGPLVGHGGFGLVMVVVALASCVGSG